MVGTGGVGSYVMDIGPALAALGHEVHVLSCRDGARSVDLVDQGVIVHVRPLLRFRGLARVVRGQQLRSRLVLGMSNYVHARKVLPRTDIVEAPDWQAEGWMFAVLHSAKLVVHLHSPMRLLREYGAGVPSRPGADIRSADWLERVTANRASLVTSPSDLLVADLRARNWLRAASVRIIRLPVDMELWQEVPRAAGTGRVVLAVGRLERLKAPELLVDAIAVLRRRGIDATATFVGRSSGERDAMPYRDWLVRYAMSVGVPLETLDERPRPQLAAAYSRCRAVCVASVYESFSLAAIEGMAAGRATVVHARIGAAEIYRGADRRQVCERTAEGLADALAPLLLDEDLAARVGETNRELVSDECGSAVVARAREAAFADVLARRGGGLRGLRTRGTPDRPSPG